MKTTSLEVSKQLKEAGIEVKSDWHWILYNDGEKELYHEHNPCDFTEAVCFPAPTLDELWELVPAGTQLKKGLAFGNPIAEYGYNLNKKSIKFIESRKNGQNPCDALAKLLIRIKEDRKDKIYFKII